MLQKCIEYPSFKARGYQSCSWGPPVLHRNCNENINLLVISEM